MHTVHAERVHYPRTPHLPWSPGAGAEDLWAAGVSGLAGREVVVTEKLDGENTTLYRDGLHARSLDSAHHPSRTWVKALQGRIGPRIPPGWRICGENLFARHSLAYNELDAWFYGFSVWDGDWCLDWDATVRYLRRLGIPAPPVLWRGPFDERALRALRLDTDRQEGYVARTAAGFRMDEFTLRVGKWVRRGHVQTDTHWMHAAVVENGLGVSAALWEVRSGALPTAEALSAALERTDEGTPWADGAAATGSESIGAVAARLDDLGRTGDARLAGILAVLLAHTPRAALLPRLARPLGMPLGRRVADLVGLYPLVQRPYPDADRRAGLVRLAVAADLGALHAIARYTYVPDGASHDGASIPPAAPVPRDVREQVEWSELCAEDAGLLGEDPLGDLRRGLRAALAGLDAEAADRCWAQAREAFAEGRAATVEAAVAATWRWREGAFPRLIQLVGPSGSGKSTLAAALPGIDARISLDGLREERGSRSDQRANPEVLRDGLDQLDRALAAGGTVVWDATSLNRHQRSLVLSVAARRDALVTQAVACVTGHELGRRNATRDHPVPPEVLAAQLRRYSPPYPGEGHRLWYVGAAGSVDDVAGSLADPSDSQANEASGDAHE
jgi:predicted kinase